MKQKVHPAAAVAIVIVAVLLLGVTGMKLLASMNSIGEAKPMTVKITNPDDPKYRRDPRLAGGQ